MVGENITMIDIADFLTGLAGAGPARAWLDATDGDVMAMLISLPRLQSVNLAYGKQAGDQVLVEMAHRIREFVEAEIRPDAAPVTAQGHTLIARLAGGQFLLASRDLATSSAAGRDRWQYLAEALSRVLAKILTVDGDAPLNLVPRIALLGAGTGCNAQGMIDRLAQAAATLERLPGRRVLWADAGDGVPGGSMAMLEADLLGAMHRDEIAILFQPQFDIATGALTGAEALARWQHPQFGLISADTLFAVADRGDHVAQLSHHIATRALTLAAAWPASRTPGRSLRLSLNITAEDFALGDVTQRVRALLAQTGFSADRLTLEITEQSLIGDFDASALALQALAEDGVQVALDDFGTGYSNFRTLKVLPLDTLKLDQSLVREIAHDPRDCAIVAAMIAMARALDLKVVAEGIETEAQLAILADEGCDVFQGFLRSGPITAKDFAKLVEMGS